MVMAESGPRFAVIRVQSNCRKDDFEFDQCHQNHTEDDLNHSMEMSQKHVQENGLGDQSHLCRLCRLCAKYVQTVCKLCADNVQTVCCSVTTRHRSQGRSHTGGRSGPERSQ